MYLDEELHIAGIGRNRDEVIPFAQLSQGAKEQLLLALRAAVALELSKEEPQILILDDVLVNTDPVRQERVLDYLQQISTNVQISEAFSEGAIVATLSQQLSWSHFKELLPLKQPLQREFYAEMCRVER